MKKEKIVAIGIVEKGGKILLIRRVIQEGDLQWCFPGGEIETKDGTEQEAIIREVKEETNINCLPVSKLGERIHPDTEKTLTYWRCTYKDGKHAIQDPKEIADILWASPSEVFKLITTDIFPPVKLLLEEILAK